MNRPLLLLMALQMSVSISAQSKAGFRKLNPGEAAFLTKVYYIMAGAVPHTFYDWKTDNEEDDFDALKLWSTGPGNAGEHRGDCPISLGKTEPYAVSYTIIFMMPDKQSKAVLLAAYKKITDYNSPSQISGALKSTAVCRLTIDITTNVMPSAITKMSYCGKTPPARILLPVPAKLALLGRRTDNCPIMAGGKIDMTADYYDTALIFLGKPVVKKPVPQQMPGLVQTGYSAGFDRSQIGHMTIQNMIISIHGDAADINVAIRMIDWKKLYYLVDK
jgi:hypothetical protein